MPFTEFDSDGEEMFGLQIFSREASLDVYLESEILLNEWMEQLQPVMISSDIEEDFIFHEVIEEETGATTYRAELQSTGKNFAIKSIPVKSE